MFNFDEVVDRHNTISDKWDIVKDKDVLPLWVADMDFKAAPAIYEAVNKMAAHGVYGYGLVPDEYYEAIISFHERHYKKTVKKDWIIPVPAVVPAISAIIQGLALPGDEVIVQTPAYNCFFSCITNSACVGIENKILYKDGKFELDFDALEKQASSAKARFLLFCNPQNPTGRLWTKAELQKVLKIAKDNNLIVISDEIHCDIHPNDSIFHAFSTLDESFNNNVITVRSASKTFNTAGLKNAYIICQNDELRNRIDRQVNINEVCDVDPFGIAATIAAYTNCDDWLIELNNYIQENYKYLVSFFKENYPLVKVADLQSTYLAWVDCSCFNMTDSDIKSKLLKDAKILVNNGAMYHSSNESFIRINLGCTKATLVEALNRFKKAF